MIQYSLARQIVHALQNVRAPLGFYWQIPLAMVPGLAAREVAVGALGPVYALLACFVFATQCLATLAVARRGTNSWRIPLLLTASLFALAYAAAFVTYRVTL